MTQLFDSVVDSFFFDSKMTDIADRRGIKGGQLQSTSKISPPKYPLRNIMSTRHQIIDRQSFETFRHPAFIQAVNRVANLKCIEAIKSGKLRVVTPNSSTPSEYTPRMDFIDDPAESILTAVFEIPGIKTNDISLRILDSHLVVSGERRPTYNTAQQSEASAQDTAETPKLTVPIQELRFGTFRRAIRVPEGIKDSEVKASLNEGMLTVTWPRTPDAAVRTRRPHSSSPPTASAAVQ